jgi:tetratricopeptide (TPR) repeat protein
MESIWEHALAGGSAAWIGRPLPPAPADVAGHVVRVACDRRRGPLGALREARDAVLGRLGPALTPDPATQRRARLRAHLKRRLHEGRETPDGPATTHPGAGLFTGLAQLAEADRRPILVLDAVDSADAASVDWLARRVASGPLPLPTIWVFRGPTNPAGSALLDALRDRLTEDEILEGPPTSETPDAPVELPRLPSDALRVLRAGLVAHDAFDIDVVARLLDLPADAVVEALQGAVDAGLPVEDDGAGRFRVGAGLGAAVRDGITPSLASVWRRKLAAAHTPDPGPATAHGTATAPSLWGADTGESAEHLYDGGEIWPGEAGEPIATPPDTPPPAAAPRSEATSEPQPPRPATPASFDPDPALAAELHEAAGEIPAAVARHIDAAHEAAVMGASEAALEQLDRALWLARREAPTPARRHLHIELLLERGTLQWAAPGAGSEFTLHAARETLAAAADLLGDPPPPDLAAEVWRAEARVLYDLGDPASLEAALRLLTDAANVLRSGGDPIAAAETLADQAAVWVRIGDPLRAWHLLDAAREALTRRANEDEDARVALAEVRHLIARLPFHVDARQGREQDAISMGREHARLAERDFEALGLPRERARVRETLGRLELKGGRLDAAEEWLTSAFEDQRLLGDLVGLAITTEALSELAAARGRPEIALRYLDESLELNLAKGSPRGVAYLRRAFNQLARSLPKSARPALASGFEALGHRLAAAEQALEIR